MNREPVRGASHSGAMHIRVHFVILFHVKADDQHRNTHNSPFDELVKMNTLCNDNSACGKGKYTLQLSIIVCIYYRDAHVTALREPIGP